MKSIKTYLIVVSVLLVLALGAGVYVWFVYQDTQSQLINQEIEEKELEEASTEVDEVVDIAPEPEVEPIIIEVDSLSDTQQKTLNTFGFQGETITVTKAMISCAESEVGKERFEEIVGGVTPSPLEAIRLLPCFKK